MEVKRKRGRPRKNSLPEEIQTLVQEVEQKQVQQEEKPIISSNSEWDVPADADIKFFDSRLSYEITGYKPINETQGLDFDPNWFTETRDTFIRTGHYCQYRNGSKAFSDFWREQYKRCKYGMTVNGYTITGDHYYFLNFYRLKDLVNVTEAGSGRGEIFPNFMEGQYEWFHYLKLARIKKMNALMMKARETGYSEIEASILAKSYTVIKGSVNVCAAYAGVQLDKLWEKIDHNLSFLDLNTDGGFSHGRISDTQQLKRAGQFEMRNGTKVPSGWLSQIQKIPADDPGKLRGDRTDVLVFEEAGLWPKLTKAFIQADALVGQVGSQWGIRLIGGTGGSTGAQLEGLRKMYYNPEVFGILPYRHNYTQTGEETISAFFLPCFKSIKDLKMLDSRGFISDAKGKEYFDKIRATKATDPEALVTYCAEYCYNAEEAFSLEGDNKFNKVNIAEQLTNIRALKKCPPIETGFLEYKYKDGAHIEQNLDGFKWIPNSNGKIKILEHPLWTLPEKRDEEGNVIWRPPERIRDLYVIGIDGIDIGKSQTSDATKDPSDFCLTVFRRTYGTSEPQFVAIYKDRPNDIRECYKIAIKLAQYYNAVINIEATRQSIIPYARERKLLKLFMKRPRATLGDSVRNMNKQYGTPATPAIIDHQTDLIADYVNDYCYLIWFDEMLDELNRYTDENKRKFDIIASMAMALLADEELQGIVPKTVEEVKQTWQDIGFYTDQEGRRRYGVIPKQNNHILANSNLGQIYDDNRIRTSNTRLYSGYL